MIARLTKRTRALLDSESGNSLVEFAILAPVMVLLLIGLVDVGRYMFYAILAANAARAGVAYGAQGLSTALDSAGMSNAALQDGQNLSQWTATGTHFCTLNGSASACPSAGSTPPPNMLYYVQVQVNGTFKPMIAYPGFNNVKVTGSAAMRVTSQ